MGSSRLPGKPLLELGADTALSLLMRRLRRARVATDWTVATSSQSENDAIEHECRRLGIHCVRGSEHDVVHRLVVTAETFMKVALIVDNPYRDLPAIGFFATTRIVGLYP